jgi:hypothetical protein
MTMLLDATGWWHFCWLLYAVEPAWSHRLDADFKDHAEHTYAEMVVANPAYETTPWDSALCGEYGSYASLADLLRQVSHASAATSSSPSSTCSSPGSAEGGRLGGPRHPVRGWSGARPP